jgi:hypothetical protein
MTALEQFDSLFGELNLSPDDGARWLFLAGWNSALEQAMKHVNNMPFPADTRASFAVYFQQMMHIDPNVINRCDA